MMEDDQQQSNDERNNTDQNLSLGYGNWALYQSSLSANKKRPLAENCKQSHLLYLGVIAEADPQVAQILVSNLEDLTGEVRRFRPTANLSLATELQPARLLVVFEAMPFNSALNLLGFNSPAE